MPVEGAVTAVSVAAAIPTRRWRSAASTRITARATTLFEIELEVHRHECLALVGESGSGKTTLARCVAGLHKDYTGAVYLGDDRAPACRP